MSRRINFYGYSETGILTPSQILGANYYEDWDANDLTLANGDPVLSWQSNGLNAGILTSTLGSNPTYSINEVGSNNGVAFNGVDGFMRNIGSTNSYNFLHNGDGGTVILVVKPLNTTGKLYPVISNRSTGSDIGFQSAIIDGISIYTMTYIIQTSNGAGNSVTNFSNSSISNNQFNSIIDKIDSNASPVANRSIVDINNGTTFNNNSNSGSSTTLNASNDLFMGRNPFGSAYLEGVVIRAIIADTLISTSQEQDINNYLQADYGTFPI